MWTDFNVLPNDEETVSANGYSTNSLFTISCGSPAAVTPAVHAEVQNHKMALTIDRSLFLLEDEHVVDGSIFLSFNAPVDAMCMSHSGSLVVCALADGNVHGVHISGVPLFNVCISADDIAAVPGARTFANHIRQLGGVYFLCCATGRQYRLWNVDEKMMADAVAGADSGGGGGMSASMSASACNETILNNVNIDRCNGRPFGGGGRDAISCFVVLPALDGRHVLEDGYRTLSFAAGRLVHWRPTGDTMSPTGVERTSGAMPPGVDDFQMLYDLEHFVLGLATNGRLYTVCPHTLLIMAGTAVDYLIDDIVVIDVSDTAIELLLLTRGDPGVGRRMLTVDYPSMRVLFELPVPSHAWLIRQAKSSANLYYLHGEVSSSSAAAVAAAAAVQQIALNIVTETLPAERLKKLIQRGHLTEAEQFARAGGLSLNAVYEAQARRLACDIGASDVAQLPAQLAQLLALARLITDTAFLLSLRHIDIADRQTRRTFLEFLLGNVPPADDSPAAADIAEQIRRLDTLQLIDANECLLEWQPFVFHAHLLDVVVQLFATDMPNACLIWQHHTAAMLPLAGRDSVERLLAAIPARTSPFDVILWVRHFVPTLAQHHPAEVRRVAAWCADRTRSLQSSPHWPEVGLEFAGSIRDAFAECRHLLADWSAQHSTVVAGMERTIRTLHDLNELRARFKLTLTLDDYTNDTPEATAARILNSVALPHLADVVRTFLHPKVLRRRRCLAAAVVAGVRFLVAHRRHVALWQERAVVLVQQLHNETERLECALLVLKAAPVPWAPVLRPLVAYRQSGHPLAQDIGGQYELQGFKLLLIKYGWPADAADNPTKLVSRMCRCQLPELFADVRAVHEMTPAARQLEVLVTGVTEMLRLCGAERAAEFVDSLHGGGGSAAAAAAQAQAAQCCDVVLDIVGAMLDDPWTAAPVRREYIGFLALIRDRWLAGAWLRERYERCRRAYTLREHFGLPVLSTELADRRRCAEHLRAGVAVVLERAERAAAAATTPAQTVQQCWSDTMRLADALAADRVQTVVLLCAEQTVHFTCTMARWVLQLGEPDARDCAHWMDLAALLFAQQLSELDEAAQADAMPLSMPLAYRLLQRAVQPIADPLFGRRELMEWPRVAHDAYGALEVQRFLDDLTGLDAVVVAQMQRRGGDGAAEQTGGGGGGGDGGRGAARRDSMSVFDEVVVAASAASADVGVRPASCSEAVVRCVAAAMRMFVTMNVAEHALFGRMARFYGADEERLEDCTNAFVQSLEHLVKSKQHAAAFAVIHLTLRTQRLGGHVVLSLPFASMFHKKALRYALSQREPNFKEALNVLVADQRPTDILQYLGDELKSGHQKINYLTLAEMYSGTLGDRHKTSASRRTRLTYVYFTELCKTDAALKTRHALDFSTFDTLMRDLANQRLDVDLLRRMSADFGWDLQHVLVKQILVVLDQQQLEFDVVRPADGAGAAEEIRVRQPAGGAVDILKTCAPYIDGLVCTKRLAAELLAYMATINFYFYEQYLNVIDMLVYVKRSSEQMELWRSVLLFLKHKMTTRRRKRIGQLETDAWMASQPGAGIMPQITLYRFPFWTIVKEPLRNLLDDELFVDNCEEWFPLIRMHADLNQRSHADEQDHFCMSAVKNSMTEHCKVGFASGDAAAASNGWCLEPVHNAFRQSIMRLVQHITKRSCKLFILYFVTNYLPEGADQIDAAHECYRFALEHADEFAGAERTQRTVTQIRRKYPMLKTQHLMHAHGLADERLFQLVERPRELIEALYGHEAVLRRVHTVDINALTSEIAELHQLNPREVQLSILTKWLAARPNAGEADVDETFYEDLNVSAVAEELGNTEEDVIKIHYILQSWDFTDAAQWLVSFIFAEDGHEAVHQIKAFEVFMKMDTADGDASYAELFTRDQYLAIKSTHLLKQLGYNMPAAKFAAYDKRTILRKVWQAHAAKPLALELIAIVCQGYGIHMPQIWNGVLKQMVALNMVEQLAALLDGLSAQPQLLRLDGLAAAWAHVIRAPFRGATGTRSDEQERALCRGLRLLQACPVFGRLDVVELARTCVRLQRPHMAAVTLAFVGSGSEAAARTAEIVAMVRTAAAQQQPQPLQPAGAGGDDGAEERLRMEIVKLEEMGIYPAVTKAAMVALK